MENFTETTKNVSLYYFENCLALIDYRNTTDIYSVYILQLFILDIDVCRFKCGREIRSTALPANIFDMYFWIHPQCVFQ